MTRLDDAGVVEHDEFWAIPLEGRQVTQCRVDYQLTLVFWNLTEATVEVSLGVPFRFRAPDGRAYSLDPNEKQEELGPALGLFGQEATRAIVSKDSRLELDFANGASIEASPHPEYEAWEVTGPGTVKFVCMPGGGEPAIWT